MYISLHCHFSSGQFIGTFQAQVSLVSEFVCLSVHDIRILKMPEFVAKIQIM